MGQGDDKPYGINNASEDYDAEYQSPASLVNDPLIAKSSSSPTSTGCCSSMTYHLTRPQSPVFRYIILVCCCFLTFGSYYSYDIPAASGTVLNDEYGITQTQASLLYSVYSIPNMVLPFFGGYLVDRVFGLRLGGIIFCLLVLIGQWIFTLSSVLPNPVAYWVALAGRFVFGYVMDLLVVTTETHTHTHTHTLSLSLSLSMQAIKQTA
jgi:predicted MFS family arabinose efflux permease